MTRLSIRTLTIALVGFGLTLLFVGLTPLLVARAQDTPSAPVETVEAPNSAATAVLNYVVPTETRQPTGDNSYCLLCHNVPWRTKTLADGTLLNLYVSSDLIESSVHGATDKHPALGCVDCHIGQTFPHFLSPTIKDGRTFSLSAVEMCVGCHQQQATELESGRHAEAIREGNTRAAVCTDCHGAHDVAPVAEQPGLVAGVCGDCHTTTLTEFHDSPHVNIGPLGCGNCHSPHSQRPRVGTVEQPDTLCLDCHNNLPNLLIHEQHSNEEHPVGCVECHMETSQPADHTLPVAYSDTPTGHTMRMQTSACTTCHEGLVASGEWARLVTNTEPVTTSESVTPSAESVETAEGQSATTDNNVQLLQGLILGLGFGVTFGVVFVSRGNRSSAPADDEESNESNPAEAAAKAAHQPPQSAEASPDEKNDEGSS